MSIRFLNEPPKLRADGFKLPAGELFANRYRSRPVGVVLLEDFGAESFNVKLRRSNGNNSAGSFPRKVASPMTTGMPKFRKESHPERAKGKWRPIPSHLTEGCTDVEGLTLDTRFC